MFQSTRPVRGATNRRDACRPVPPFQSTRPVRGATKARVRFYTQVEVSIHAPRAGRDSVLTKNLKTRSFQSTRPVRGATRGRCSGISIATVSIHAPREGRDFSQNIRFRV